MISICSFLDSGYRIETICYNASGTFSYRSKESDYNNHYNYDSTFYYRNENNCLLGKIRYKSRGPYRFLYRYDSSLYIYSKNICKADTVKNFRLETDGNNELLSLHFMIIYVLDSNGSELEEYNYRFLSDSVFFLQHKVEYQYDMFNREIHSIRTFYNSNHSLESIKEYDEQDNVIYHRDRSSDSTKSEWTNEHEVFYQFDDENRRIYCLSNFNWNNETKQYEGFSREKNIYNEHDLLVEHEYIYDGLTIHGYHLDYNYHIIYEDRCDGFYSTSLAVSNRTETGEDYIETRENKYRVSYSYYDIAICEELITEQNKIVLYPNPANEYLHIHLTEVLEDVKFRLINSMGQEILTRSLPDGNYFSLNLYGLHSGIYILHLIGQNKEYSERFVLSH